MKWFLLCHRSSNCLLCLGYCFFPSVIAPGQTPFFVTLRYCPLLYASAVRRRRKRQQMRTIIHTVNIQFHSTHNTHLFN